MSTAMRFGSFLVVAGVVLAGSVVGCSSGDTGGGNRLGPGSGAAAGTGATTGTGATGTGATGTGADSGTGGGAASGTGATAGGGAPGSGATNGTGAQPATGPGTYALPPPDQCKNQYYVSGCIENDPTSACGGVCTSANACANEGKPGEPGFICPRYMLFADEMQQASVDDAMRYGWGVDSPFTYAVVGHDTDASADSVDDPGKSPCCQCYQLVPALPENQVRDQNTQEPTIPLPKPLVVQAFNTGATTKTFDIFVGSGGLGAFNACAPGGSGIDSQYTSYPAAGQPNGGGIKAVGEFGNGTACKDQYNLVTEQTIESAECRSLIESTCNQIESATPAITEVTRRSCIESNRAASLYHQNWTVYAKRVKCPRALTEVTGCKLIEDLPDPDPNVTTPEAAAADPSFKTGYSTTTMQDCCKPSCSWKDKVTGAEGNHTADGEYNAFYTCTKDGTPLTE